MSRARDEDFAYWGAYIIEDLGIVKMDLVIGLPSKFGAELRSILTVSNGRLYHHWAETALRLYNDSPAMSNMSMLFSGLCQLAASHWYVRKSHHGS